MEDNNTNELDALMISELPTQATANETDLFEVAIVDANSASGYASKKESAAAIADAIVGEYQYPLRITGTTAKTIAGAINELKNLISLLPQFAIEVVQTLPVSDISTTTIYLVPASDPEQGNYYEEYIYVNNAWELAGTTAVDLSEYYTSAQVDTLLAAKADSASLATVATSGAYSDLSGKPTIDSALDITSTNAVENRAVTGAINSIKNDISVEGSASGDIATFVDGSDNPLKELKISIVAQQSGSGDPSPDNVRPITGWTGAKVSRTGKNLVDVQGATITSQTTVLADFTLKKGTYTLAVDAKNNASISCRFRVVDYYSNTIIGSISVPVGADGRLSSSFTISEDRRCKIIANGESAGYSFSFDNVQLEFGSVATTYEPYNGNIYNIDWEDEAGTVYGGTINVKTGELTVTHKAVDMGDLTWSKYPTGDYPYFYANLDNFDYTQTEVILQCSTYKAIAGKTSANFRGSDYNLQICNITNQSTTHNVGVQDSNYTDVETFTTAVTGQRLVYKLATPIEYDLTPTEIRSLLGINNIWADCGSITELKYTRDLNLCINDIIARIEALEGGSNTRSLSVSPMLTKSLTIDSDKTEGKTEETEEETKEEAQNER